jgi:hypothetical protein
MPTIDFTGSYRDATRGMTIKALQERQKALQDEAAAQMAPREMGSPWQGAAQIAGVIGSRIQEARAANDEQAGRQRFAELLAGGLSDQEIGEAITLDPDNARFFQEHQWATEKEAADRAARQAELEQGNRWDVEAAKARVAAERDAATERARVEAAAAETEHGYDVTDAETKVRTDEAAAVAAANRERAETLRKEGADVAETKRVEAEKLRQEQSVPVPPEVAAKYGIRDTTGLEYYPATGRIEKISPDSGYTPGAQKEATDFVTEMNDWEAGGGEAGYISGKASLQNGIKLLREGGGWVSGTGAGGLDAIVKSLPDSVKPIGEIAQQIITPDMRKARDSIRTAVQENLKTVLGSQFAAVEGEQLLNRAFDPMQDSEENIRRAELIMQRLDIAAELKRSKIAWYREHGQDIRGWNGEAELQRIRKELASLDFDGGGGGGTDVSTMSDEDLDAEIRRREAAGEN